MVSESGLDLQRRNRSGPPRNLASSDFFHVPAKPRQYRNSVPYLAAHGKCSRSRRLNRPKSSLGFLKDPNLSLLRDREISRRTRVSQPLVSKLRKAVISLNTSIPG